MTTWIIHLAPVGVCFLIAGQILEMEVAIIVISLENIIISIIIIIKNITIDSQSQKREDILILTNPLGCCW